MPSVNLETFTPDNLIAQGNPGTVDEPITLESGQNLTRGTLLGKITASGKYKISATGAGDGSETPSAILTSDTDASAGDKKTSAYVAGVFNQNALTFGSGHTASSVKDGLRDLGIFLKDSVQN